MLWRYHRGQLAGSKLVHEEAEGLSMTLAVLLQRSEGHMRRPPTYAEQLRTPSPPLQQSPQQQQVWY